MNTDKTAVTGERNAARKERITKIVPPMIVAKITGAIFADIYASGKVKLTYEDGQTEIANLTIEQLKQGRNNYFSLVGSVQSYRKN